jgi:hypothetical protein
MRALETAVGCLGGDHHADDGDDVRTGLAGGAALPRSESAVMMCATSAEDEVRPGHAAVAAGAYTRPVLSST